MLAYCSAFSRQVEAALDVGTPAERRALVAAAAPHLGGWWGSVQYAKHVAQHATCRKHAEQYAGMSIPSLEICRSTLGTDPFRV